MPDRELGGYATSQALPGGGVSIREIAIILSPAAGTISAFTEQTFTVPGVLASDRCAYLTETTGAFSVATTAGPIFALAARVSAISVVSIPLFNAATSAVTPTASTTFVFGIASARVIP